MRISHLRNPMLCGYTLGQSTLELLESHAYLGVEINNNLTWKKQNKTKQKNKTKQNKQTNKNKKKNKEKKTYM